MCLRSFVAQETGLAFDRKFAFRFEYVCQSSHDIMSPIRGGFKVFVAIVVSCNYVFVSVPCNEGLCLSRDTEICCY